MLSAIIKTLAFLSTAAVAIPYTTAILCNLAYGWPQIQNKFRRAFNPRKVYALNFVLIQKLVVSLRYMPLYMQWKAFYRMASAVEVMKDVPFGRNDQKLDLHLPRGSGDGGPYPVIMFVYGGAWGSGDKQMYGLLCSAVANKLGVIVCCPNHSTYPQGYVDDMIQDCVDCLSWLYTNVEHYQGNKEKIMLVGHSSGAHLCAMSILELLHDELVLSSSLRIHPAATSSIHFTEGHYNGSGDKHSEDKHSEDKHSTASSGSFCILNDGADSNENDSNVVTSEEKSLQSGTVELVGTQVQAQQSETDLPDMSGVSLMESDLRDLQVGQADQGSGSGDGDIGPGSETSDKAGEECVITQGPSREVTPGDEDSGDDDSVVTVRTNDVITQPSISDLRKCIKAFVGLAGVYHIGDHFRHEMSRGIEDMSTMARSMYEPSHFDRFSPTHIVSNLTAHLSLPKIVLVHGTDDYVVPLSATTKFAEALSKINSDVTVRILPSCDHYEICLDLMRDNRKFYRHLMTVLEDTAKVAFSDS